MLDIIRLSLGWWYGAGWQWVWDNVWLAGMRRQVQAFSMPALLRTLGAPYRQTYTGQRSRGLDIHGALDNVISRSVGLVVRVSLLLAGAIGCLLWSGVGMGLFVIWGLLPLTPLLGLFLSLVGPT